MTSTRSTVPMNENTRTYCRRAASAVIALGFTDAAAHAACVKLFETPAFDRSGRCIGTAIGELSFAQIVNAAANLISPKAP